MITEKQARKLEPTVKNLCEFFPEIIREAAKANKREVLVTHGELQNEAFYESPKWNKFVSKMSSYGFVASLYHRDHPYIGRQIKITW